MSTSSSPAVGAGEPHIPEAPPLSAVADRFAELRPRLFGIAYRMLGSVADAEDLVQDVWLKWQVHDRSAVRDATGFLVTMTTRLAINATQTARARHRRARARRGGRDVRAAPHRARGTGLRRADGRRVTITWAMFGMGVLVALLATVGVLAAVVAWGRRDSTRRLVAGLR